jgi:lipopolysaccharide transport system ATP-binding protein
VGDFSFQAKCIGKMSEVARAGRTVLFVSHNLAAVQNLCQTAILLNNGTIAHEKDQVEKVLMTYENAGRSASGHIAIQSRQHAVRSPLQITGVDMFGLNDRSATDFKYGESIRLRLQIDCRENLRDASAGIALRANGMMLTTFLSGTYDVAAGQLWLECVIPGGTLLPGLYEFDVGASRAQGSVGLDYVRSVASFSVSDVGVDREWMHDRRLQGVASLPSQWSMAPV